MIAAIVPLAYSLARIGRAFAIAGLWLGGAAFLLTRGSIDRMRNPWSRAQYRSQKSLAPLMLACGVIGLILWIVGSVVK